MTQRLAVLAIDAGRAELAAPDQSQAATMRALREGLVRLSEDIHAAATRGPAASGRGALGEGIASSLSISARTVAFHKYQLMETLGLHPNAELVHVAIKQGLVEL